MNPRQAPAAVLAVMKRNCRCAGGAHTARRRAPCQGKRGSQPFFRTLPRLPHQCSGCAGEQRPHVARTSPLRRVHCEVFCKVSCKKMHVCTFPRLCASELKTPQGFGVPESCTGIKDATQISTQAGSSCHRSSQPRSPPWTSKFSDLGFIPQAACQHSGFLRPG